MKLFQNVCHHEIKDEFETVWLQINSRSSGQVLEKHFIHSKGVSSYPTHGTQGKKSSFE